jgi:NitT/TauT family transport system permease protein
MRPAVRTLAGLGSFFLLWEAAVRLGVVDDRFVPPPSAVALRLLTLLHQPDFLRDLTATVLAWLIGLAIAAAIAIPAGLLLGAVPVVRAATRDLIEFLRPLPPVAIVPLLVLTIGSGPEAKITLAAYASVWPMLFNTIYAFDEIDPQLLDAARSFGLRRPRLLATVALPHTAPFAFTGLRLSASIALLVTVSTEFLAGSQVGVGAFLIDHATTVGNLDWVLAGTVMIGIVGYLANDTLERVGRRVFAWADTSDAELAR